MSQVLYQRGVRRYACSASCREELTYALTPPMLGEIAAVQSEPPQPRPSAPPNTERSFADPGETQSVFRTGVVSVVPPLLSDTTSYTPAQHSDFTPPFTGETSINNTPSPPGGQRLTGPNFSPAQVRTSGPAVAIPFRQVAQSQANQAAQAAAVGGPVIPGVDLPQRIAVFNHKGGTGKTTTSVSLAAGLAMKGKKVLLVDTDAQGNVGVSLNVRTERTLYHVLVMGMPVPEAAIEVRPGLDLLPCNETLAAAELFLAGKQQRDRVLAQRLNPYLDVYDHVIVDCSPSLSLMNQNALCLVDSVLVPVACDYLSLVGMRQVIKTIKNVNQLLHHPVRIWGVLPTFYDARANICREAVDTLKQHFGPRCLRPIRQAIKVKEAPTQGQTIFEYAQGSTAADDYSFVVDAVLGNVSYEEATSVESGPVAASA